MDNLDLGEYRITFDREATRSACAAMAAGGAEECRCAACKNFAAQKPVPYPPDFRALLDRLGIDPNREIEVYTHRSEDPSGIAYDGWFYFVGSVEPDESTLPRSGPYPNAFEFYFIHGPAYEVAQFKNGPVSRVEFMNLRLPWANGFSPSTPPG